ncbi:hypothetical protein KM043_012901 [Ampulex compressa]|nr:hypothetical protein KM043_012901 [Ampulex compressa]
MKALTGDPEDRGVGDLRTAWHADVLLALGASRALVDKGGLVFAARVDYFEDGRMEDQEPRFSTCVLTTDRHTPISAKRSSSATIVSIDDSQTRARVRGWFVSRRGSASLAAEDSQSRVITFDRANLGSSSHIPQPGRSAGLQGDNNNGIGKSDRAEGRDIRPVRKSTLRVENQHDREGGEGGGREWGGEGGGWTRSSGFFLPSTLREGTTWWWRVVAANGNVPGATLPSRTRHRGGWDAGATPTPRNHLRLVDVTTYHPLSGGARDGGGPAVRRVGAPRRRGERRAPEKNNEMNIQGPGKIAELL